MRNLCSILIQVARPLFSRSFSASNRLNDNQSTTKNFELGPLAFLYDARETPKPKSFQTSAKCCDSKAACLLHTCERLVFLLCDLFYDQLSMRGSVQLYCGQSDRKCPANLHQRTQAATLADIM